MVDGIYTRILGPVVWDVIIPFGEMRESLLGYKFDLFRL